MTQSSRADVDELAENEQVFGFLLALHGGIHLMGTAISWRLFEVDNIRYDDVWPVAGTWPGWFAGGLWLVAALTLALVGVRLAMRRPVGRLALVGPLLLSVALSLTAFPSALPATAVSGSILFAMATLAVRRSRLSP